MIQQLVHANPTVFESLDFVEQLNIQDTFAVPDIAKSRLFFTHLISRSNLLFQ